MWGPWGLPHAEEATVGWEFREEAVLGNQGPGHEAACSSRSLITRLRGLSPSNLLRGEGHLRFIPESPNAAQGLFLFFGTVRIAFLFHYLILGSGD